MKKIIALIIITGYLFSAASAGHKEKDYQKVFTEWIGGKMEVVLSDKSRVDILTDRYSIEVDFAKKWAEGIGQSLYYSIMTGKYPGIVLIMKSKKDTRYLKRLMKVCRKYNIQVWTITSTFEIKKIQDKSKP